MEKIVTFRFNLQASSLMSVNSVTSVTRPNMHTKSSSSNRKAIDGLGDVFQLPCGGHEINFSDGSRLSFRNPDQGGGVCFTDTNGATNFYATREQIPLAVRKRFQQIQEKL